jgi:hypothetical protein
MVLSLSMWLAERNTSYSVKIGYVQPSRDVTHAQQGKIAPDCTIIKNDEPLKIG